MDRRRIDWRIYTVTYTQIYKFCETLSVKYSEVPTPVKFKLLRPVEDVYNVSGEF